MNNNSNSSANESSCEIPAALSVEQCFTCFLTFLDLDLFPFMSFFLWITSFAFNLILIVLLSLRKKINIFEKIFLIHALVDFLINLLDFTFVIIFTIIPYWPFNSTTCAYYTTVTNALGSIEIFTVTYMCLVRLRCIQAPKTYQSEFLVKYFLIFHMFIWAIAFVLWTLTSIYIIEVNEWFDQTYCQLEFGSNWLNVLILVLVFLLPLSVIGLLVVYIFFILKRQKANVQGNTNAKRHKFKFLKSPINYMLEFHTSAQTKLVIITLTFLLQYSPYYVTWLVSLLCPECVSSDAMIWINFLAYCPSFVNPIVIFSLNFKSRRIN